MSSPSERDELNGAVDASDKSLRAQAYVDAAAVAEYLGVSRAFVYEHAGELGAIELPGRPRKRQDGTPTRPKPRLRFRLSDVDERLSTCSTSRKSEAPELAQVQRLRTRQRSPLGTNVELLPIRGRILAQEAS